MRVNEEELLQKPESSFTHLGLTQKLVQFVDVIVQIQIWLLYHFEVLIDAMRHHKHAYSDQDRCKWKGFLTEVFAYGQRC